MTSFSWSLSSEDLKKAFEKFGSIEESTLIQTAVEKRSKGYGFVTFEKAEDAEKAIEAMDGTELAGRKLQVALAKDRSKEPPNLTDDRVHVGNLPSDYSKEEFVKLLSSFGECKDFDVLDGNGKKFGYATFSSPDDATKAVESLNGSTEGGNVLEVMFARKRKPRRPRKKRNSNTTTTTQGDVIPNQLFVRHLPRDATKESITEKFKTFGSITSVSLSKRRRFGFVTYESAEDATKALKGLHDTEFGDSKIEVEQAHERSTKSSSEETKEEDGTKSEEKEESSGPSNVLWVGGLPADVKMEDVQAMFEEKEFEVSECKPGHKKRGHFFCYITLDTHENAKKAVDSMDGMTWNDTESKIKVEIRKARTKKKQPKKKKKKKKSNNKKKKKQVIVEYYDNELFVKNLPDDTTKESLLGIFKKFEESIHETKVSKSRAEKIIAFVTFTEARVAGNALKELNGKDLGDGPIEIQYSRVIE